MSVDMAVILALAMLVGNAFFVGAEFGLVSARRSTIELLALKGSLPAKITLQAMEQVSLMLAGAQLGVTVCSLIFGATSEPLVAGLLVAPLTDFGLDAAWIHPISLVVALIMMVYVHVVIGEMVPKNLALSAPAKVALVLIPPLVLFVRVFRPLIVAVNGIAAFSLKLFGVQPKQELTSSFGRDEVAGFIKESLRDGLLSTKEEQLLSGSLQFDQSTIESIIIRPEKVVSASSQASANDIEALAAKTGYSRFPIIGKDGDYRGYIHIKDILRVKPDKYTQPLSSALIRPLVSVQTSATLRQALGMMQQSGAHLAKVVDVGNKMIGIIAFEDVLEELIGEIRDDSRAEII